TVLKLHLYVLLFFFSSRRRHTRSKRDWSSDVCSSDLRMVGLSMITMPATTAGLNVLENRLIPHGTAMTNTMRQVAASIGTATLITIMTLSAKAPTGPNDHQALIHSVNVTFYVSMGLAAFALVLAFFVKDKKQIAQ